MGIESEMVEALEGATYEAVLKKTLTSKGDMQHREGNRREMLPNKRVLFISRLVMLSFLIRF